MFAFSLFAKEAIAATCIFLSCVTSCIFLCFVFISSLFSAFIFVIALQHMTLTRVATDKARIARRTILDNVRFFVVLVRKEHACTIACVTNYCECRLIRLLVIDSAIIALDELCLHLQDFSEVYTIPGFETLKRLLNEQATSLTRCRARTTPVICAGFKIACMRAGNVPLQQWPLADCLAHILEDVVDLHVAEYMSHRQHKHSFLL